MTRRLRIPGLVDILRTEDPTLIHQMAGDARLGRDFGPVGPLLNRLVMGRIRAAFHVGGTPFSAVAPQDYPGRAETQRKLEARLADLVQAASPENLATLADYVRGTLPERDLGPTVQTVIGQLFAPDYEATRETWSAACLLDAAPRSRNPFAFHRGEPRPAVVRARDLLAQSVNDDPAALHATAIAVHTLVRSLQAMRALWRDDPHPQRISPTTAVARSLRAPAQVLRMWSEAATTLAGDVAPGSLAIFDLDKARLRQPDGQTVFMAGSWSHCPAHGWTTALLASVWTKAGGEAGASP